jgi:hypothetical protein
MLSLHDQSKGPWILLHVVSVPWTFFVAALDKGPCRKAVCRRHSAFKFAVSRDFYLAVQLRITLYMCIYIVDKANIFLKFAKILNL